jgi:CMP-N-acetylneuraminic acid synthetase
LIPARGGSKGLPGKNILPLSGKPLIAWTILQGLASEHTDDVVVSTDDKKIAQISRRYGADVPFMRPDELATDTATSIDVVFHALDHLSGIGKEYDYVAVLEPTSPLRKKGDLDKSIRILIDSNDKAECLVSLGKIALEHPIYAKKIEKTGCVSPYFKVSGKYSRRQDLPIAYFPYGVIYLSKVSALRKYRTFYQKRTISYLIERWQNYEIDDAYDYKCIVSIMKEKKGEIG